ncbi:MAG: sigma factor-like helix-turn-helix DNA-binding protein [Nanoarchaeota archaeon]
MIESVDDDEKPLKLEQRVRQLDNAKRPAKHIARELSELLGASRKTIETYIGAKRKGFKSLTEERKKIAKDKGFSSYNARTLKLSGFTSYMELQEYQAKKAGWSSINDYRLWLATNRRSIVREGITLEKQAIFEESLEYLPENPNIIAEYPENLEFENEEVLKKAMQKLSERELIILNEVSNQRTYKQIGIKIGITSGRVEQIYNESMEKIWSNLRPGIPYKKERRQEKIEDGELLFAHLMLKSLPRPEGRKKRPREALNELKRTYEEAWGREAPRWITQVDKIKMYQKRIKSIRERVFSREAE